MGYKIVFIDIDGTLKTDEGIIKKSTIEAIKQIKSLGFKVVITSGRNLKHTIDVSKLACGNEYVISSNGTEIYNYKTKKTIFFDEIDHSNILRIYQTLKNKDCLLRLNSALYSYSSFPQENYISFQENDLENIRVSQLMISSINKSELEEVKEEIINKYSNLTVAYHSKSLDQEEDNLSKHNYLYDIINKTSSKGSAVVELCRHLEIDIKDAIIIGDNYNDLSMFELDAYKVAMLNAPRLLHEKANCITLSNNDDGVGEFLKNLFDDMCI